MSTTEAPPIQIDVTQAIQVLAAGAAANMVDPTKTPESDKDKIEQATSLLTLALQVKGIVDIVGQSKVPKWPAARDVLAAAGMIDGPPAVSDPVVAPVPDVAPVETMAEIPAAETTVSPPEPAPAAPSADEPDGPSPSMSREQAERAADEAEAGMDDQDGHTWGGREGFIREMAGMDGARPISDEWWVNDSGSRFLVLKYGGGPTMEIRFAGSTEVTDVPAGYAVKLSAQQQGDEPVAKAPLSGDHNPTPKVEEAADAQAVDPSVDVAEKLRLTEEKRVAEERAARQAALDAAQVQAESEPVVDPGPPTAEEEADVARHVAEEEAIAKQERQGVSDAELEAEAKHSAPEPPVAEPVGSTGVAPAPEPDMAEEEIAAQFERKRDEAEAAKFGNDKSRTQYTKITPPPADSVTWQLAVVRQVGEGSFYYCDEDMTFWDIPVETREKTDFLANYSDEVEVHNDEGDEVYRGLMDEIIRVYSPNGMPVPLSLQNPPEAMPDDLTKINDLENRRLHSQFNALSARAKYQHDIEAAISRKCEIMRKKEMKVAIRAARAEHGPQSKVVFTEIENYAEEADNVVLWAERQVEHEERAKAYKSFFDIYSQNVKVLSRDWTMKDTEREG